MFRFLSNGDDVEESSAPIRDRPSLLDRAQRAVGLQPEPSIREDVINGICPSLTFQQRLYGFAICWVLGTIICISSMFSFGKLVNGHPAPFAIAYSLGNIIALSSTTFLVGPKRQMRKMTHPTRWGAALVYVFSMVATLVLAVLAGANPPKPFRTNSGNAGLIIIFIIIQFCSLLWYCLSYIPYGRRIVMSCCSDTLG
uniref:Vesicle transport protein n=1 Tax=Haptolina ericina TaxID=156174 RepID=A0A7S3AWZ9_9EUKA|mmetsp:Transcript_40308/g.91274  ORF Transcript_40308/g.91274 Transcript_40308/m.91274 type:complete len:198 (+) Transcript_40308:39-632(+)